MTTLLLDIGNTRLKWARLDGADLHFGEPRVHAGAPEAIARGLPRAPKILIAHVLGTEREPTLAAAILEACGFPPQFARVRDGLLGLQLAYADPARLGIDRFLGLLAVRRETHGAFGVANAGTALTFDAVGGDGRHRGGLIAPGLATAHAAVRGSTRFELRADEGVYGGELGLDTESCVRQGALQACAGLLDRMARRHPGIHVLAGGDAQTLAPHLDPPWVLRPQLVLEGLRVYAEAGGV